MMLKGLTVLHDSRFTVFLLMFHDKCQGGVPVARQALADCEQKLSKVEAHLRMDRFLLKQL